MIKLAPSILAADFSRLAEEVRRVEEAGVEYLHIDVMDGHFVPNITIGPPVVASLRSVSRLFFDVHLMIENPEAYIPAFAEAGADLITVHAEATRHLDRALRLIRDGHGCKAGVALNPATSVNAVENVLTLVDQVLLMTVNPGFGGQSFIREVLPKINVMRDTIAGRGLAVEIEVDGGIDRGTAPLVVQAGATVLVAGSAVFRAAQGAAAAVAALREAAAAS